VVATAPLSIAIFLGIDAWQFAGLAQERLLRAFTLMFILQLLLTMGELQVWASGRFLRTLTGGAVVLGVLSIGAVAWVALARFGIFLPIALGTSALTLGLMGLTVFLFQQRPSFTSG
jgi:hypothetical protein